MPGPFCSYSFDEVVLPRSSFRGRLVVLSRLLRDVHCGRSFLTQYDFFGGEAGTTEYTNQTLWTVAAWLTAALAVIYMFLVCCLYKHIRMAIALVKESGSTIRKMPSLVLYPFFTYFWVTVVFVYCAGMSTFILSSTATLEDLSTIGSKLNATQVSELNFDQVYVDAQVTMNDLLDWLGRPLNNR